MGVGWLLGSLVELKAQVLGRCRRHMAQTKAGLRRQSEAGQATAGSDDDTWPSRDENLGSQLGKRDCLLF